MTFDLDTTLFENVPPLHVGYSRKYLREFSIFAPSNVVILRGLNLKDALNIF